MTDNTPATFRPAATAMLEHGASPSQQFSRERQVAFLDALSNWGNVRAAAGCAGVSRSTVYRMRRGCYRFRNLWDAALLLARPQVEAVLADRALNGVEEQVFYHGEEIATRRRYDARLLLAHLGRLDRLECKREVRDATVGFDFALEELLSAREIELVGLEMRGQADEPFLPEDAADRAE